MNKPPANFVEAPNKMLVTKNFEKKVLSSSKKEEKVFRSTMYTIVHKTEIFHEKSESKAPFI